MAENEQTKVCPLCAETIKAAARVCPHCRKIQKRGFFINRFDLIGIATVLLLLMTFFLLARMLTEGRRFSPNRDKIEVLSSKLTMEISSYDTNVVLMGILTNRGIYSWNVGRFEVRFFDSSGKIIDADKGSDSFTVLPGSDHSFRLTLYSRKSIPEHASYKVLVRSASEPNVPFGWYY